MILEKYAKENGFENTQVFADDGYSGVNFERPAFRRMLDLIEDGKIGVIITKDLSRHWKKLYRSGFIYRNILSEKQCEIYRRQ